MGASGPCRTPPGGDPSHAGEAVIFARKTRGLTQEQAAGLAAISVSLLRKIEQGRRSLTPDVEQALTAVLGPIGQADSSAAHAHIENALPVLREVMDCYDMPADMRPRGLAELHAAVAQATTLRLGSRYTELAAQIPG